LRTKTNSILLNSAILSHDVFALSETWLHPGIHNLEIFNNNFTVYRKDRHNIVSLLDDPESHVNVGWGVLIAVKSCYHSSEIPIREIEFADVVGVHIKASSKSLVVISCYIRPKSKLIAYEELCSSIEECLRNLTSDTEIIIVGDFNFPNLCWSPHDEDNYYLAHEASSKKEIHLLDSFNKFSLQQISNVKNSQNRQLDLVFTTDFENSVVMDNLIPLSVVDKLHPPLLVNICLNPFAVKYSHEEKLIFDFPKTDFVSLSNFLSSFNLPSLLSTENVNEAVYLFYELIYEGLRLFVPTKKVKSECTPKWMNRELKTLKNRKNKAWNNYLRNKTEFNYSQFIMLFNEFKLKVELRYQAYISMAGNSILRDPKYFWNFVNSKRKCDEYPEFLNYKSKSSNDPKEIANFFKEFFASSLMERSSSVDSNYFHFLPDINGSYVPQISLSANIVYQYLSELNGSSSPGPDNVPEIILKNCAHVLSEPLSIIFNASLRSSEFPDIWKESYIRPIHKKGQRNEVSSYRNISKMSDIPKLFEKIIYEPIYNDCKSLINPCQHGFVRNRSTTTNLVEITSKILNNMEARAETVVVYTDMSKAFDLLPHSVILFKLEKLGFQSWFVKWVDSYLKNRIYRVIFRQETSSSYMVCSGVPQGSHLGPLLFILSINDIVHVINDSSLLIYADDIKIFKKVTNLLHHKALQEDLNKFSVWCNKNGLHLNVQKCSVVTYSRKLCPSNFEYKINDIQLPIQSVFKDLGIYFDVEMTFKPHFNYIINKSNQALGFVKRWSKEFRDPYITKSLYVCFVRSILEYCSPVWSPVYEVDINRIESIQKNFLKFALRDLNWNDPYVLPPYENRLKLLRLDTLEKRREIASACLLFDIFYDRLDSVFIQSNIFLNEGLRSRSPEFFRITFHRTNYGKFEPINRMLMIGNKFKTCFIENVSKQVLKNTISDLSIFLCL